MTYSLVLIFALNLIFASFCHANRQLSFQVNPNCGTICDNGYSIVNVVYIQAVGNNDTIHYLWSTSGTVSMFMARTSHNAQLRIDWPHFLKNSANSFNFTEEPSETVAVIFTRLYEYQDTNDKVNISLIPYDNIQVHETAKFNWTYVTTSNTSDLITANFNILGSDQNGTFELSMNAFGSDGFFNELPSLKHTAESFQFEVVLNNFTTTYNKTRFAVEFAVLDSENYDSQLNKVKTIDDEYTPGVFVTYTMRSADSPSYGGNFLQWKPVCYTSTDRTTESSTESVQDINDDLISNDNRTGEIDSSLAYAYYGEDANDMLRGWLNVSFGLAEDKFYQKDKFLSWSVVIGIGNPPQEKFSSLVIIVITVGFGVPALLIVAGGIFILVRRCRKQDNASDSNDKLCEEDE